MKKSSILIFLGPVIILLGGIFRSKISLLLFGTESLRENPYPDYALTNWTSIVLLWLGFILFILGWIFFYAERKNAVSDEQKQHLGINRLFVTIGIILAVIEFLQIALMLYIASIW